MAAGAENRLFEDYQAWIQRVQDTCDAVRYTYSRRGGDPDASELLGLHVILQMLRKPNVFRYHGMPFSARIGSLAGPFLNGESDHSELTFSVSWDDVKGHLEACPGPLQAALVCSFVYGDTVAAMSDRMGWSTEESTQRRAEVTEYLSRAGIPR